MKKKPNIVPLKDDTSLLEPGIPNYNLLNQSYVIMIMAFDLFGNMYILLRTAAKKYPSAVLGTAQQKYSSIQKRKF